MRCAKLFALLLATLLVVDCFFVQREADRDLISGTSVYCGNKTHCECAGSTFSAEDLNNVCVTEVEGCNLLVEGSSSLIYTATGSTSYTLNIVKADSTPVCTSTPTTTPVFLHNQQNENKMIFTPLYAKQFKERLKATIKDTNKVQLETAGHWEGLLLKIFISCGNQEQCVAIKFTGQQEYPILRSVLEPLLGPPFPTAEQTTTTETQQPTTTTITTTTLSTTRQPTTTTTAVAITTSTTTAATTTTPTTTIASIAKTDTTTSTSLPTAVTSTSPTTKNPATTAALQSTTKPKDGSSGTEKNNTAQMSTTISSSNNNSQHTDSSLNTQSTAKSTTSKATETTIASITNSSLSTVGTGAQVGDTPTEKSYFIEIILGCAALFLILVFLLIWLLACRRRRRRTLFKVEEAQRTVPPDMLARPHGSRHASIRTMENNSLSTTPSALNTHAVKDNPLFSTESPRNSENLEEFYEMIEEEEEEEHDREIRATYDNPGFKKEFNTSMHDPSYPKHRVASPSLSDSNSGRDEISFPIHSSPSQNSTSQLMSESHLNDGFHFQQEDGQHFYAKPNKKKVTYKD